jgi:hypothetical protein
MMGENVRTVLLMGVALVSWMVIAETTDVAALRAEVRVKGWIVYDARTEKGDMDIFLCRPDGGSVRNIKYAPPRAGIRFFIIPIKL